MSHRGAVDLGIGNCGRDIVARVGAPRRCEPGEIRLEIRNYVQKRFHLCDRIAGCAGVSAKILVIRSEYLLSELEHHRLVLPWNAENLHDDTQWIMERNVAGEVAFGTMQRHAVDSFASDHTDAVFQRLQLLWHQPTLSDAAVLQMVRRVHVDHHAKQVWATTPHRTDQILRCSRPKNGCVVAIAERVILTAY